MINICDSCMEDNFAIAGNMLASGSVISSMKKAFLINSNVFFPKRLLLTLILKLYALQLYIIESPAVLCIESPATLYH